MFETLTEKLDAVFKKLKGRGRLDEENIAAALRDIRMALLEADVHFKVVKDFIEDVRVRAVGKEVLESISPGQQVVKIVHDRLAELMGGAGSQIRFGSRIPAPIMMVGLQGCGKTTTAVKLAKYLAEHGRRAYLVSADVYRPAAIEQLRVMGEKISAGVFDAGELRDPIRICREAVEEAKRLGYEVILVDTAGRLHIDEQMMAELQEIKREIHPAEILFVADAMTGQDAVNVAAKFNEGYGFNSVIDAAGPAATLKLSMELVMPTGIINKVAWGPKPVDFSLDPLLSKGVTLQGSFSHSWDIWEKVLVIMGQGQMPLDALITHELPLEGWKEGFDLIESRKGLKVVLKP